jgi:ATP-binding cassette subfamily F protein 3
MLHINDLTYRLGDRILIDRATVAIPTGGRVDAFPHHKG